MAENKGNLNNWELLIAGPKDDPKYLSRIDDVIGQNGLTDKVHFLGMLDKKERILAYSAANLFLLPSHTENFGIVIAEAMAAGLPVITTKNTPWSEIKKYDCGWWVELTDNKISGALKDALIWDMKALAVKGQNGRALVKSNYSWDSRVKRYSNFISGCSAVLKNQNLYSV